MSFSQMPESLVKAMLGVDDQEMKGFWEFAKMYMADAIPDPHPIETLLAKLSRKPWEEWTRKFVLGPGRISLFYVPCTRPWTREDLELFFHWSVEEFEHKQLGHTDEVDWATWIMHFLGEASESGRRGSLSDAPGKHIRRDRFKELYGIDMLHVRDALRELTAPRD